MCRQHAHRDTCRCRELMSNRGKVTKAQAAPAISVLKMQSLTANISEEEYNTPTKQKQRFSYQRSSTSGFIELHGRLDLGPCSASPLATAASTVACLESRRTMRRYALLACLWSVGCVSLGFAAIAVRQLRLVGISVDLADFCLQIECRSAY